MDRSPTRWPLREARLALTLLLAACWSEPHQVVDEPSAGALPPTKGGPPPGRRAGLPLPPPLVTSAPQATLVRPALPEPGEPEVHSVRVWPPEPAAGPLPKEMAATEVERVWPAQGGGPQPTVGPRRDPVEPPLLDGDATRSWVFAVRLNGEPVSLGSVFLEEPTTGRLLAQVAQLRLWRVRVDETRVLAFEGEAFYPLDAIPGARVEVDRARLELALTVPPDGLDAFVAGAGETERRPPSTGSGGFLDYDVLLSAGDRVEEGLSGLFEVGAFGSLGVATTNLLAEDLTGSPALTRLETTFTRDLPESRASLRFGDTLTGGGALAPPVRLGGIQWATNFATDPSFVTFPVPAIGGLAEQSAVVDVFIDNLRQATADVPAGPFRIDNVPVVTGAGEVQLVVRDLLGRETIVTQPYYVSSRLLREGLHEYSYEAGFLRRRYGERSFDYGDPLASATHRYGVSPYLTVEGHADAAPDVQSAALGAALRLGQWGVLDAGIAASLDEGDPGGSVGAGYEYLARRFSVGLRSRYASDDYAQAGEPRRSGRTDQLSLGLNLGSFGNIGLFAVSQEAGGSDNARSIAGTWSVRLGPGNLMLRAAKFFEPDDDYVVAAVYSVPLGGQRSGSLDLEKRRDGWRARPQIRQGRGASDLGIDYRIGGEVGDDANGVDGRISYQAVHGAAELEVERFDGDSNLRAGLNGSIGLVDGTVRASRRLGRAFAVVMAPGFANVRVYLDNREVGRTDAAGKLMLPDLRPYEVNRLRLEVADLPLEARIGDAEAVAIPYDRSGVTVAFDVALERQATAVLETDGGARLAPGTRLADAAGRVSAIVGRDGFAQIVVRGPGGTAQLEGRNGEATVRCAVPELPEGDGPVPDLGRIVCR